MQVTKKLTAIGVWKENGSSSKKWAFNAWKENPGMVRFINEPRHEKTNILHMRKHRRASASQ